MPAPGLSFDPLVPWPFLALALLLGLFTALRAPGVLRGLRLLAIAAFLCVLAGPQRTAPAPAPAGGQTLLALVDRSPSMTAPERAPWVKRSLAELRKAAQGLDLRIVEGPADPLATGTYLAGAVQEAAASVPPEALNGVVVVTDGQLHDAPPQGLGAPLHLLLAGEPQERDLILRVLEAPHSGAAGMPVILRFVVEGRGPVPPGTQVSVTLSELGGGELGSFDVVVGQEDFVRLPPLPWGRSGWALEAGALPSEVSTRNNRAHMVLRGERAEVRALLLSGRAHPGVRAWREALQADPAVALAHVAILRTPAQARADRAAVADLSLSSAPLGEMGRPGGLADFDLVVLDAWVPRGVIPDAGWAVMADWVQRGGALIVAGDPRALADTALADILPGAPAGAAQEGAFSVRRTPAGQAHPVTAPLGPLGPWAGRIPVEARKADVLLGAEAEPVVLLAQRGAGRVVQIVSDSPWLWARGYQGGGPWTAFVARAAAWALGHPAMEPGGVEASLAGPGRIALAGPPELAELEMTAPDGARSVFLLSEGAGEARVETAGVYAFSGGDLVTVGAADPPEWRDAVAQVPVRWAAAAHASGGGIAWAGNADTLNLGGALYGGQAVARSPLLRPWQALALLLGVLIALWGAERAYSARPSSASWDWRSSASIPSRTASS